MSAGQGSGGISDIGRESECEAVSLLCGPINPALECVSVNIKSSGWGMTTSDVWFEEKLGDSGFGDKGAEHDDEDEEEEERRLVPICRLYPPPPLLPPVLSVTLSPSLSSDVWLLLFSPEEGGVGLRFKREDKDVLQDGITRASSK